MMAIDKWDDGMLSGVGVHCSVARRSSWFCDDIGLRCKFKCFVGCNVVFESNVSKGRWYTVDGGLVCLKRCLLLISKLLVTEKAAEEVLALPIFPELTDAEQRFVVSSIARFYGIEAHLDDAPKRKSA